MAEIILIGSDAAFLPGARAMVFSAASKNKFTGSKADAKKVVELKPEQPGDSTPWAVWGDNDNWPNEVKDDISASIMLSRGLESRMKVFYGKGVMPFKMVISPDGKETPVRVKDKQIDDFLRHSRIEHYIACAIRDHEKYCNYFPRFILSKDRSRINLIVSQKARYSRWEKIDKTKGKILNCYQSAFFGTGSTGLGATAETPKLPVINMFDDADEIRAGSAKEYIYRAMYPLSDNDYYAEPAFNSARKSGWVDIEADIPEYKKYMFTNQVNIKYHIQIPYTYWENSYKDEWRKLTPAKQKEKKSEFYKKINDYLTGNEKAGATFLSEFGIDPLTKKEIPGIKITVLENNNKDGEYLADIDQVNTQISYAIGWDRALIGQSGKSMGSGSGSDKREAFLINTSMLRLDRDFIFQPLNFIRDFNKWDPEVQFGFPDMVLTTLDENPTGTKKVVN